MELTEKQIADIGKGIYHIVEGVGAPEIVMKSNQKLKPSDKTLESKPVNFYQVYPEFFNPT